MSIRRVATLLPALTVAVGLTSCAEAPSKDAIIVKHHSMVLPTSDWFQRQIAEARRARAERSAAGDKAGARRAYTTIMVPACERVERSGPDRYRARCHALLHPPSLAPRSATAPAEEPVCDLERDDSKDTPEQIAACSD